MVKAMSYNSFMFSPNTFLRNPSNNPIFGQSGFANEPNYSAHVLQYNYRFILDVMEYKPI